MHVQENIMVAYCKVVLKVKENEWQVHKWKRIEKGKKKMGK